MNIRIKKESLVDALNTVGRAITTKSDMTCLQGVYIEAKGNNVIFRGTDKDISIETLVDGEILSPGKLLVEFRVFNEVVKKLPNSTISINNDVDEGKQVDIICQKSLFTLVTMNCEEYPSFPELESSNVTFNINQNALKELITSTIYAVAQDDSRPILKGLLLENKENLLTIVALDGYRMSLKSEFIDANKDFSVVVDAAHLNTISKLLSSTEIEISISNNHILFTINNTKISCRLFEGNYLNYASLINDNHKFSIDIIGEDFYNALERSTSVSKMTNLIHLKFDYKKEIVLVQSKSNMGNSKEEIPVSILGLTEDFEIGFNVKYLIDIFKNTSEEEFTMYFNSNVNPCIIRGKGNENETFLVLPIRISK